MLDGLIAIIAAFIAGWYVGKAADTTLPEGVFVRLIVGIVAFSLLALVSVLRIGFP